ncbi:MAG: hypothetical protein ChlgKO_01390 [Chlamydiales bacterium]
MRAKIGSVVEVDTMAGKAYVQYTHQCEYGGIIRVLQGFFENSLLEQEVCQLAQKPHQFIAIMPLKEAVNRKIFRVVADCSVPDFAKNHPLFRSETGDYEEYWMWDGEKEWFQKELSEEEKRYPLIEVWNDTLLKERIAEGWRPEQEFE